MFSPTIDYDDVVAAFIVKHATLLQHIVGPPQGSPHAADWPLYLSVCSLALAQTRAPHRRRRRLGHLVLLTNYVDYDDVVATKISSAQACDFLHAIWALTLVSK